MAASSVVVPLGPARVDITGVRAGDRNLFTITLTQAGTPVDLTDMVVTSQARLKSTDPTPAISAIVEVLDAVAGEISVAWPGDDVITLLAGKAAWSGVWDLQLAPVSGDPYTICAGTFKADMDVTR